LKRKTLLLAWQSKNLEPHSLVRIEPRWMWASLFVVVSVVRVMALILKEDE